MRKISKGRQNYKVRDEQTKTTTKVVTIDFNFLFRFRDFLYLGAKTFVLILEHLCFVRIFVFHHAPAETKILKKNFI